jgi:F0F1-type ATP synthase membrane subunit b/b'
MARVNKNFESLTDEAIDNIRADREQTQDLLKDLVKYISSSEDRHRDVGLTAAKYVETLQRSNEQLVKIAGLKQKEEKTTIGLSQEERDEIFKELGEEK